MLDGLTAVAVPMATRMAMVTEVTCEQAGQEAAWRVGAHCAVREGSQPRLILYSTRHTLLHSRAITPVSEKPLKYVRSRIALTRIKGSLGSCSSDCLQPIAAKLW